MEAAGGPRASPLRPVRPVVSEGEAKRAEELLAAIARVGKEEREAEPAAVGSGPARPAGMADERAGAEKAADEEMQEAPPRCRHAQVAEQLWRDRAAHRLAADEERRVDDPLGAVLPGLGGEAPPVERQAADALGEREELLQAEEALPAGVDGERDHQILGRHHEGRLPPHVDRPGIAPDALEADGEEAVHGDVVVGEVIALDPHGIERPPYLPVAARQGLPGAAAHDEVDVARDHPARLLVDDQVQGGALQEHGFQTARGEMRQGRPEGRRVALLDRRVLEQRELQAEGERRRETDGGGPGAGEVHPDDRRHPVPLGGRHQALPVDRPPRPLALAAFAGDRFPVLGLELLPGAGEEDAVLGPHARRPRSSRAAAARSRPVSSR